jgi:20S proteasome subunit beta 5
MWCGTNFNSNFNPHADGGPCLYYIDNDANCINGEYFCVGSGSSLAYAVLDSSLNHKSNHDNNNHIDSSEDSNCMYSSSLESVIHVAIRAIRQATHRDAYSGGYINVLIINSTGIHHIERIDSRQVKLPPY